MLPRWHILLGAVFTFIFWIVFPETNLIYLILMFLASFLIDFDHYASFVSKTGKIGLFQAFDYHKEMEKKSIRERKRGIRRKGDFHIFHTIEIHILVLLLGFLWEGFFFVFIGMLFHSILDIISIAYEGYLYRREFFFVNWLKK